MGNILTGRVVKSINEYELVINKGSLDGVEPDNIFLVYRLDDEIIDPDTNESLGYLELVCGEGKPKHIQEHITTIITSKQETRTSKRVVKSGMPPLLALAGNGYTEETYDPEIVPIPFENVDNDCLFKQIR